MTSKPVWISHRGLCESAIENTREAFEAAIAAGFRAFETDLRITNDGHIVLCHDETLKRTAGLDISVHRTTKAELKSALLRNGASLMFFEDILLSFLEYRWTLEFKPQHSDLCIQRFLEIIFSEGLSAWAQTNVKFLVWSKEDEKVLREALPQAKFYALFKDCKKAAISRIFNLPFWKDIEEDKTYGVTPRFFGLSLFQKKYVRTFHHAGAEILAYLPETTEDARAACEAGFDEILTNHRII